MLTQEEQTEDQAIIASVVAGKTEQFRLLVEKYQQRIATLVISMIGECAEADDIGQETFIRFYKALKKFKGESTVLTYISRIAMNLCYTETKKRQKRREKREPLTDTIAKTDISIEAGFDRKFIEIELQRLKPKYRAVVVLRLIEEYDTNETAEILQIPVGTVLSRLKRGVDQLRSRFKKEGYYA